MKCRICYKKGVGVKQKFGNKFCISCDKKYKNYIDDFLLQGNHSCEKKGFEFKYIKKNRKVKTSNEIVKRIYGKIKISFTIYNG